MSHAPSDPPSSADNPGSASLELRVNGEPRAVPEGCSVADLIAILGLTGRKIAVAVNREVVPRSAQGSHSLCAGDRIEVLEAVGGG